MRKTLFGLVAALTLACGGTPPTPAQSAPAAAPTAQAKPAPSVREASSELRRYWAFGATPGFALYADVDSLLHTALFESVVPAVLNMTGDALRGKQRNCVDALLAGTRELAIAGDGRDAVALLSFSEDGMRALRSTCIGVMFPVDRIKVDGANEAYASDNDVVVIEPGVVLVGPKSMVEAALATQTSAWPAGLALQPDQHAVWSVALPLEHVSAHGSLSLTPERFRIELTAELPSEELAKDAEAQFSVLKASIPKLSAEHGATSGSLLDAVTLTRDGQRLNGALEVRGATADQARDLGTMASLAVYGVRRYLQQAKAAEARAVTAAIAKSYAAALNEPAPPGKPSPKKKLVSLPPVPAAVPRGSKYQSAASDWTPWESIHFSLSAPQYYQYQVIAAKDGSSADVIAHGDLNGDGKTSQFLLKLQLDPKTKQVVIAPALEETEPSE